MNVAETIKALRKAKGWSQERLANKSGIHRLTISYIERGESKASVETIEALLGAMGCELIVRAKHENFHEGHKRRV